MAYLHEADQIRPDIDYQLGGSISVYPADDGEVALAAGLSSATYTIRDSGGTIKGTGAVTVSTLTHGSRAVGRYTVPVPALPADSDYSLEVVYTIDGVTRQELIAFDAVRSPLGQGVTVNDIVGMRTPAAEDLESLGRQAASGSETEQELQALGAKLAAQQARQAMTFSLRNRAARDGYPRAYQVIDRRTLSHLETIAALRELYRQLSPNPEEGEDSYSSRYRHYRDLFSSSFEEMVITYMAVDTEEVESVGNDWAGNSYAIRRGQA